MSLTLDQMSAIGIIGLLAGVFGGLAGIGGSVIMLPALDRPQIHHMYMAAAMLVNIAVAVPSTIQHYRAKAIRLPFLRVLLPSAIVAILAGVLLSNRVDGEALRRALALFLVVYCLWNVRRIIRPRRRSASGQGRIERGGPARLVVSGTATGLVGGLLGLGGGILMVPLLQLVCNMRLKNAISTSSAVVCVTSIFGAATKVATLPQRGESMHDAALYALLMAPTAVLGALLGARLTHRLPVAAVRTVLTFMLLAAAIRMVN